VAVEQDDRSEQHGQHRDDRQQQQSYGKRALLRL
jgi:hypothetical protein